MGQETWSNKRWMDEQLQLGKELPGGTASSQTYMYDTFTDFPSIGEESTLYVATDTNVIYRYDETLNTYVLLNDPDVINPDAPEEGGTFYVRLATSNRLNACTYNNGTAGVGATLTGNVNGIVADITSAGKIDVVVAALGDVILVKNQVSALQNGIYEVTQLGDASNPFILTRIDGYDQTAEVYPSIVFVAAGSNNANRYFSQSTANPVIGTNNLVYGVSTTSQPISPLLFIDTVTTTALPACTYTNGTTYPTLPGSGATLRANVNGALGAINGLTLTSGKRIIVKDQVNAAHNGTYTVTNAGSATQRWVLTRWVSDSSQWYNGRTFMVTNPGCNQYGSRWSVSSPLTMSNLNYGVTNIVWSQQNQTGLIDYNGDVKLSSLNDTSRINIYDGNQIDIYTDGTIDITANTGEININSVTHQNDYIYLNNYGIIYGGTDGGFEFTTNFLYLGDAANADTSLALGNAAGAVVQYDGIDMVIQNVTGNLNISTSGTFSISSDSSTAGLYYNHGTGVLTLENNGAGAVNIISAGNINMSQLPSYVNDAAADADTNLASGALYKLNAGRAIYQKP